MGWQKDEMERREEGAYEAARRDNGRCGGCGSVVSYADELGPNDECPSCVGALDG